MDPGKRSAIAQIDQRAHERVEALQPLEAKNKDASRKPAAAPMARKM